MAAQPILCIPTVTSGDIRLSNVLSEVWRHPSIRPQRSRETRRVSLTCKMREAYIQFLYIHFHLALRGWIFASRVACGGSEGARNSLGVNAGIRLVCHRVLYREQWRHCSSCMKGIFEWQLENQTF